MLFLGNRSFFLATYYMYFPFLTCEVHANLDVADRQNAHSMTLAVRAIVKLFQHVKREDEINREILAFSVSHDARFIRIYGHYAVIDAAKTTFYRHPIHELGLTVLDGKERWTAYRFTKNVYELWMPTHCKRLCSAIDDFSPMPFLQGSGLSQGLESHHLSQSTFAELASQSEDGSQSGIDDEGNTNQRPAKRPRI